MNQSLVYLTRQCISQNNGCIYSHKHIDELLLAINELNITKDKIIIGPNFKKFISIDRKSFNYFKSIPYKKFKLIEWDKVGIVIFLNSQCLGHYKNYEAKLLIESHIYCPKVFCYPPGLNYKDAEQQHNLSLPDRPMNIIYTSKRLGCFGADSTEDIYKKYFNGYVLPNSKAFIKGPFSKKRGHAFYMKINKVFVRDFISGNYPLLSPSVIKKNMLDKDGADYKMKFTYAGYLGILRHKYCEYYLKNYINAKKNKRKAYMDDEDVRATMQNEFIYNYVTYCAKLTDCAKEYGIEERFKHDTIAGLSGIADFWSFDLDTLEIVDFKSGEFAHSVNDNRQLQAYTILLLQNHPEINPHAIQIKHTIFNRNDRVSRVFTYKDYAEWIKHLDTYIVRVYRSNDNLTLSQDFVYTD